MFIAWEWLRGLWRHMVRPWSVTEDICEGGQLDLYPYFVGGNIRQGFGGGGYGPAIEEYTLVNVPLPWYGSSWSYSMDAVIHGWKTLSFMTVTPLWEHDTARQYSFSTYEPMKHADH